MKRALELAAKGFGSVSPNPMVGCVIVHKNKIVAEGWHEKYGGPHAEVNAFKNLSEGIPASECDVYVTLEPCSHYGKTPPCADLIVREKPKRLFIGSLDPNPLVAGQGIERIKKAGIETVHGILDEENKELNKRFFTLFNVKRPYIILKWAQTNDGFIARKNYDSKWISCEESRKLVHQWRGEEDAIMVGKNTALHDNPKLNVRWGNGKDPVRVVLDKDNSLPKSHFLFDQMY